MDCRSRFPHIAVLSILIGSFFVSGNSCSKGGNSGTPAASASADVTFSPTSGPINTTISINGLGPAVSLAASAPPQVFFKDLPATVTAFSGNTVLVQVPPGARSGPITIKQNASAITTASSFLVTPAVFEFDPPEIPVGHIVTIKGAAFEDSVDDNLVLFGSVPGKILEASYSSLEVTVPASATSGPLSISNASGTALTTKEITIIPVPQLLGFEPSSAPVGASVVIQGLGFRPDPSDNDLLFTAVDGSPVNGTVQGVNANGTEITATVPAGAYTGPVSLTTVAGAAVSPVDFLVEPTITEIDPEFGVAGTLIRIIGNNFHLQESENLVFFSGAMGLIPAAVTSVNATGTQIIAPAPAGVISGPVTVTTPSGTAVSPVPFAVYPPPSITGISPTTGPLGAVITIDGVNFEPEGEAPTVEFSNGVEAVVVSSSDTEITVNVPSGAEAGPITVTSVAGTGVSPNDFIPHNPRFFFATNQEDGTISGYSIDPESGMLFHNGYLHVGAGTQPVDLKKAPGGPLLLAALGGTKTLATFLVDDQGQLAPAGTPAAVPSKPTALFLHPSLSIAYVSHEGFPGGISVFDYSSGGPVLIQTLTVENTPQDVVVSPDGLYAYVTNTLSATISRFSINPVDGKLTSLGTTPAAFGPFGMDFTPDGAFLYVTSSANPGSISTYEILAGGAINEIDSDSCNGTPIHAAVDFEGKYLYVSNFNAAETDVTIFSIDPTAGTLTLVNVVTGGDKNSSVTLDPFGRFAYATNRQSNDLTVFDVNQATGMLENPRFTSCRTAPTSGVIVSGPKDARFLPRLIASANSNAGNPADIDCTLFDLDATSGVPSLADHGNQNETQSYGAEFTRDGRFLFILNFGGNTVSTYQTSLSAGGVPSTLNHVVTSNLGGSIDGKPIRAALDPSGRYLLVGQQTGDKANVYAMTSTTGALSLVQTLSVIDGARGVAFDPTGRFAYVLGQDEELIRSYSMDPATGMLTEIGTAQPTGIKPKEIAVDPFGRFLYAANSGANPNVDPGTISAYVLEADGTLSGIDANPGTGDIDPFDAGIGTFGIGINREGNRLYACNSGDDTISIFSIDAMGSLILLNTAATNDRPTEMAIDPSRRFLYTANVISDDVTTFAIQSDGTLVNLGNFPVGTTNPVGLAVWGTFQ